MPIPLYAKVLAGLAAGGGLLWYFMKPAGAAVPGDVPTKGETIDLTDTMGVQRGLTALGYGAMLGAKGSDGVFGPATAAAASKFSTDNGGPPTNQIDNMLRALLGKALRAKGYKVTGETGLTITMKAGTSSTKTSTTTTTEKPGETPKVLPSAATIESCIGGLGWGYTLLDVFHQCTGGVGVDVTESDARHTSAASCVTGAIAAGGGGSVTRRVMAGCVHTALLASPGGTRATGVGALPLSAFGPRARREQRRAQMLGWT